jgi:hypothetical protein
MVGAVVNATISQAPIAFVQVTGAEFGCFVGHCPRGLPEPLPLTNGHFLFLYNALGLRRKERYLATLEYSYWYQATADPNSWIFRYEYLREPPPGYPYAMCHVHVNARPASYTGAKQFRELHLPVGERVTIEAIVRHLISEHGITPISPHWQNAVEAAEDHFRDVQRKRVLE